MPEKAPETVPVYCPRSVKLATPHIVGVGIENVGLGNATREISSTKHLKVSYMLFPTVMDAELT